MKVFVYFNLHKKVWSIKAMEGENKGRVIDHASSVQLTDVVPKVSEAGRQRVLKERRKNVHAGLVGELVATDSIDLMEMAKGRAITYNPYKYRTFVNKTTEQPVEHMENAFLIAGQGVFGTELSCA